MPKIKPGEIVGELVAGAVPETEAGYFYRSAGILMPASRSRQSAPLYQRGDRPDCSRNPRLAGNLAAERSAGKLARHDDRHSDAAPQPSLQGAHRRRARRVGSHRRAARRYFDGGPKPGRATEGRTGRLTTAARGGKSMCGRFQAGRAPAGALVADARPRSPCLPPAARGRQAARRRFHGVDFKS